MGKARDLANLLADSVVGTNEIADEAITAPKLALGAVEGAMATPFGMRNRIINGACQIAQRGTTTFNSQGSFIYGAVDRFVSAVSGASTWSGSISQADIGNGRRAQQIQFTSTGTAFLQIGQRIESLNTFDMVGGKATFSGIVFHNFGGNQSFTIRAMYPSATDTFGNGSEVLIAQTSVTVATETETPVALTFDVPSQGSRGLLIEVTSSIGAQTSKSVLTWDWQLERGAVATPFERRPYGAELALCQRYCTALGNGRRYQGNFTVNVGGNAVNNFWVNFPTPMRAAPTLSGTYSIAGSFGISSQSLYTDGMDFLVLRSGFAWETTGLLQTGNFVFSAEL
jgi:hypothetical protein